MRNVTYPLGKHVFYIDKKDLIARAEVISIAYSKGIGSAIEYGLLDTTANNVLYLLGKEIYSTKEQAATAVHEILKARYSEREHALRIVLISARKFIGSIPHATEYGGIVASALYKNIKAVLEK